MLPDGSSIVAGTFGGTTILGAGEPAEQTLISIRDADVFVARYDPSGALVWAKSEGGSDADVPSSVAAFDDGSAVVVGTFANQMVLGEGEPGRTSLAAAGGDDIFVARHAADGTLSWATAIGGASADLNPVAAVTSDGSIVVAGTFSATAVFGAGTAEETRLSSTAKYEIFVARYGDDGTLEWAVSAGGSGNDEPGGIATAADGSAIVTGSFQNLATFGAGEANETALTSSGQRDAFVARYNDDGTLAWVKQIFGSDRAQGTCASTLADGSVIVAGWFVGSINLGVGEPGLTSVTAVGHRDVFVAHYLADGTFDWVATGGGVFDEQPVSITALADGSSTALGTIEWDQSGHDAVFGAGEPGETHIVSSDLPPGTTTSFAAHFAPDGSLDYAKSIATVAVTGGAGTSGGESLVTGAFTGAILFGVGEQNQTQLRASAGTGVTDVFIARLAP